MFSDGPNSMIWPLFMTAIMSAMNFTTASAWLMKMYVRPRLFCNSLRRLSTWACTETSSDDTDSSQMMNSGLAASARAMQMR